MAEAIIHAMTLKGVQKPSNISVYDTHLERMQYLSNKYGISFTANLDDTVAGADAIILAVKPQNVQTVANALKVSPTQNQLLLSIVAGSTMSTLESLFHSSCLVRSMPNTPAMVI
jgi:pyrroline-5-carboxylate reductase